MRLINRDNDLINNFFFVSLFLVLVVLCIYHLIFLSLLFIYILYLLIKVKNRYVNIMILIVVLLFLFQFIFKNIRYNNINEIDGKYLIYDIKRYANYNRILVKEGFDNIYVYTKKDFMIGDVVYIKGLSQSFSKQNNVIMIIYTEDIDYIDHKFCVNILKYYLNIYIDKHFDDNANGMIKAFLLADKDAFSDELKEDLRINGIMHLFAISGLHVSLLAHGIKKGCKGLNIKENIIDIIVVAVLSIYLILASFTASITRAFLMYLMQVINKKKFNNIFSSLDIISICFMIMIIINPYAYLNIGFVLSFLVSFSIIITSNMFKNKSKVKDILDISIVSCIVSLPVVVNINYEINILSPVINILYISIVSFIVLPFTFVVLIIPLFSFIYNGIIDIFIDMISITSNVNLRIRFPHFSPYHVFIYIIIILLFIILKRKKIIALLYLLFLIIVSNQAFLYHGKSIDFRYLNNGEASLIRYKYHNILIDTGDGYKDEVYKYLQSLGIKYIDYVFISHNHDDHYGGLEKINDNIKIKNIIVSKYNDGFYSYYDNCVVMNIGDEIRVKDIIITMIGPKKLYKEENDNSMVLYVNFIKDDFRILFTGDCMKDSEDDIIDDVKDLQIDCIKIAHHGSNTSSSLDFLKSLNCEYAVIMNSKKWKDVFPNREVIDNLNILNIEYYITSIDHNIHYDIKKKEYSRIKE